MDTISAADVNSNNGRRRSDLFARYLLNKQKWDDPCAAELLHRIATPSKLEVEAQ